MQKITPHLWFDTQAQEAAQFYTRIFATGPGNETSRVTHVSTIHDTPSGDCEIVSFDIWGYSFMAISAGPTFSCNPSISFMLNFDPSRDPDARKRLDTLWDELAQGGKVLMPLDTYPFSDHYGWIQDKFGVSWQLILTKPEGEVRPLIVPSLLFTGAVCGKAEEASNAYISLFDDSKRGTLARYPAGMEPDQEGSVMFTDFCLSGQWFACMDSAHKHEFTFTEGISLIVTCNDQAEVDHLWDALSAVPESEQCGWLKDAYGVSWQIVPKDMNTMLETGTPEQVDRVTQALLAMKKFDVDKLRMAFEGK